MALVAWGLAPPLITRLTALIHYWPSPDKSDMLIVHQVSTVLP